MASRKVDDTSLTNVANAIREKAGVSDPLNFPNDFVAAIENIAAGGIDTSDATATPGDIIEGATAYVNGEKITGTHTCEGGIDTSDATATAGDIAAGETAYVNGEKITGTHVCGADLVLQDKTVSPSTEVQTISFDDGYDGLKNVTIGAIQTETKHITENGTYTPEDGKFFSEVTVNILDVSYQNVALLVLATRSATASDTNYTDSHGYSSEIGVENGEVVLVNPATITPNSLAAYKTYVDGYIEVSGAVYYLPEDAHIIEDTLKNDLNIIDTYRVICTNAQKVVAGSGNELPDAEGVGF